MRSRKTWAVYLLTVLFLSGLMPCTNLAAGGPSPSGEIEVSASVGEQPGEAVADGSAGGMTMSGRRSINLLLLGTDARKEEISRTDMIMLAHIDLLTKKVTLVSVPRDTRVAIEDVGFTKINHAHMFGETKGGNHAGTQSALSAVQKLLRCEIDCYLKINFQGFRSIVDTLGGVDINLPKRVKLTFMKTELPAGMQHIDGELALKFVQERYSLPNGDFGRQKHQSLLLEAVLQKMSQPRYVLEWPALLSQAAKYVLDTNLAIDDILKLAWHLKGITGEDIDYRQIPGKSGYYRDPLVKSRLYYWIPDEEKLQEISALLQEPTKSTGLKAAE